MFSLSVILLFLDFARELSQSISMFVGVSVCLCVCLFEDMGVFQCVCDKLLHSIVYLSFLSPFFLTSSCIPLSRAWYIPFCPALPLFVILSRTSSHSSPLTNPWASPPLLHHPPPPPPHTSASPLLARQLTAHGLNTIFPRSILSFHFLSLLTRAHFSIPFFPSPPSLFISTSERIKRRLTIWGLEVVVIWAGQHTSAPPPLPFCPP